MFSGVYFILCEACCNCLQLKIYRVELGCGSIKEKTLGVGQRNTTQNFTNSQNCFFSFIAVQMLCKLLRGMKENGICSEIFWCLLLFRQEFPIRMLPK